MSPVFTAFLCKKCKIRRQISFEFDHKSYNVRAAHGPYSITSNGTELMCLLFYYTKCVTKHCLNVVNSYIFSKFSYRQEAITEWSAR